MCLGPAEGLDNKFFCSFGCFAFSMSTFILSWNVKGLGCKEKRATIKEVVRKCKVEVIILKKTKLGMLNRSLM